MSGLAYGTTYYIYYADPLIAGGAVTYQYATTKNGTLGSGVNFFVGSITTPVSGGGETFGNNDGGAGAQIGLVATLYAASAANRADRNA